ncbi:hypothetical protein ACFXKY_07685 [Streptomyces canus]|uniref:hypothetical protein n=1 Tax=Streptomyces canus TaxID=58343 RepID=UPI0036D1CA07
MSAPTTHDPLVVNTRDGVCWERRAVTPDGRGLYAVEGSCKCPEFVMATLAELAEHGIVGSAHVLPVPVGPELRTLDMVEDELTGANLSLWEEEQETARLRLALKSAQRGRRELREAVRHMVDGLNGYDCPPPNETPLETVTRWVGYLSSAEARVEALESERHSTNESLSEAAEALRERRDRIAELDAQLLTLHTQRGDVAQLIERERAEGEECVDIDALESALGLGSDDEPSQALRDDEEDCDHPNGYGPNGCAGCGAFRPADGEDDVRPQVRKLRALLAGQRAQAGGAS